MVPDPIYQHPDPRELVRADLAYITMDVSWEPHWERFSKVLGTQFEEAIKNCDTARRKRKRKK